MPIFSLWKWWHLLLYRRNKHAAMCLPKWLERRHMLRTESVKFSTPLLLERKLYGLLNRCFTQRCTITPLPQPAPPKRNVLSVLFLDYERSKNKALKGSQVISRSDLSNDACVMHYWDVFAVTKALGCYEPSSISLDGDTEDKAKDMIINKIRLK